MPWPFEVPGIKVRHPAWHGLCHCQGGLKAGDGSGRTNDQCGAMFLTQKNFTSLDCLFIVYSKYDNLTNAILEDTMAKTTTISVRMDADLKSDAESILSSLGLTPSQAISVFYKQITFQHGLPFPVKIPEKELNAVTINAMEEKDLNEYKNSSELYNELGI
jgi:DNA-damage-inducible protein J